MAYSNNIPEWDGTEVLATNKVGWKLNIWVAINTTTTEPSLTSIDWELEQKPGVKLLTFSKKHNKINISIKQEIRSFNILKHHIKKIKQIEFSSFTIKRYIILPSYPDFTLTPNKINNIRLYKTELNKIQLITEHKLLEK